jgi:hypothetical protein
MFRLEQTIIRTINSILKRKIMAAKKCSISKILQSKVSIIDVPENVEELFIMKP